MIQKLARWADLSSDDIAALRKITDAGHSVERGTHLNREGDDPEAVFLLLEGWAYRYKMLGNGKRRIVAILLPGDLCDTHIFVLDQMDHGIAMLSPGRVVAIPRLTMLDVIDHHPTIAKALWWATLVDEAVLREWLANIGGREAYSRIAHFLCELAKRLESVGLFQSGGFDMPMNQIELGDALGLTAVHVNRVLRRLRQNGLVNTSRQRITIPDFSGLCILGDFDPSYLHARQQPNAWRLASSA
jgi:CRP-like cAMP-binding protein